MWEVVLCATAQELFAYPLQPTKEVLFRVKMGFVLLKYKSRGKQLENLFFAPFRVFEVFLNFCLLLAVVYLTQGDGVWFEFTETFWTFANKTLFGFM